MSSVPHDRVDVDIDAALRRAAGISPYFEIGTGPLPPAAISPWRPVGNLYDPALGDLAGAIEIVADRLGVRERRVAASLFFQGYAGRLWSPVMACLAADMIVPRLAPGVLFWRYLPGQPVSLHTSAARGAPVPSGADGLRRAARLAFQAVVEAHLAPLVTAVRLDVNISEQLLWGNTASALVGAVQALVRHYTSPAVQPLSGTARAVLTLLLGTGTLRETGRLATGRRGKLFFTRRSCCLYYRAPAGGLCGDCPLRTARMSAAIER